MTCRYQRVTPRLLPAGAAVAGWVIFLPLKERVLSTARSEFGFNLNSEVENSFSRSSSRFLRSGPAPARPWGVGPDPQESHA